jgi:hypothetical protein
MAEKSRQVYSNMKGTLMVSFNIQSIVHYEFVLQGETVNQHYHIDTLQQACQTQLVQRATSAL